MVPSVTYVHYPYVAFSIEHKNNWHHQFKAAHLIYYQFFINNTVKIWVPVEMLNIKLK